MGSKSKSLSQAVAVSCFIPALSPSIPWKTNLPLPCDGESLLLFSVSSVSSPTSAYQNLIQPAGPRNPSATSSRKSLLLTQARHPSFPCPELLPTTTSAQATTATCPCLSQCPETNGHILSGLRPHFIVYLSQHKAFYLPHPRCSIIIFWLNERENKQ